MDPLFPVLPEDISASSDEELASLLSDHESAKELILNEDEDFLKGLDANEILAQLETGGNQYQLLLTEQAARGESHENYLAEKTEKLKAFEPKVDEDPGDEDSVEEEVVAEAPVEVEAEVEEEKVEEPVLVTASADTASTATVDPPAVRFSRRPPAPTADRMPLPEPQKGTSLVASGEMSLQYKDALDRDSLAELVKATATHHGPMPKIDPPGKYRFGGPEHKFARAEFEFPAERDLTGNLDSDIEKIRAVVVDSIPGGYGNYSLTASGGLCAPLEPIYSMPNFGSTAEPVWDSLPVFRAARGGVNVPTPTTIGDITTAISSISEANDALGGTFATKSCQDMDCPAYTEVAVQILAHCREYGNLNARAWPEKIAHENELTMQALSRTTETFMLDRIKTLSINVTQAEILGAYTDLVHALTKAAAGIRFRLRMPAGARFNVVMPEWVGDLLAADVANTQFDRYQAQAAMVSHLASLGFRVTLYKDDVTGGTSQGFADEAAGALDDFPDDVQYAIYPEGQFIGIDSGVLELGIVRDSVLNATNDFQVFGERFRNLAMLGPAQGALWVTQGVCPSGEFPALGTALSC